MRFGSAPLNAAAALLALCGCTLAVPDARFSCKNGEACPASQHCDIDYVCRFKKLDASVAPPTDANAPTLPNMLEAGMDSEAGTTHKPDAGTQEAGLEAGVDPKSCQPECAEPRPVCHEGQCVECIHGRTRCEADTPSVCSDEQRWQKQAPCGGSTLSCNAGVCSAVRLEGGLVSLGRASDQPAAFTLEEGRLELPVTLCGDVKGTSMCLTGSLAP